MILWYEHVIVMDVKMLVATENKLFFIILFLIFKTALNHETGDQLGTFGEITLDKNLMLLSL